MNILLIIKVKILVLIKWSYRSPMMSTMECRMVITFGAHTRISSEFVLFSYPFLGATPYHVYHSSMGTLNEKETVIE
jgi:hypothetical protein